MQQRFLKLGTSLVCLALLLSACKSSQPDTTPTTDPAALKTAAAQTASAFMTATALVRPSQTLTATPTATATISQATPTATVTPAPPSLATPTATAVLLQGERAQFVTDVTVPDGTDYKAGEVFTKTWRFRNAGTSTWTAGYALVFISGDKMGGPDRVGLLADVPPGGSVDISVNLAAPSSAGKYRGYWKLLSTSGKYIDDAVYVEIDVIGGSTPTVTSTSQVTSQATSTPTATPTSTTAVLSISNVSMGVDTPAFTGVCPKTFSFTGKFTLNLPATVSYQLEAGSDNPAFTFTLPAAQTANFGTGEQVITFVLDISSSVNGWTRLHITAPVDLTSNQASFSLTCQP